LKQLRPERPPESRPGLGKGRTSALEALKKYAGIIEGPTDLSINKKYLAGLAEACRKL
jgi:hypothetical protein